MLALDGYLTGWIEGLEDYEGRMDGRMSRTLELRELGGYIYIYIYIQRERERDINIYIYTYIL